MRRLAGPQNGFTTEDRAPCLTAETKPVNHGDIGNQWLPGYHGWHGLAIKIHRDLSCRVGKWC